MAHERNTYHFNKIGISDLTLVGRYNELPISGEVDIRWGLNGLICDDEEYQGDIIIIEPFEEQVSNSSIESLAENNTRFTEPINLSKRSTILIPMEKYNELKNDKFFKKVTKKMDIRVYEGDPEFATEMLFFDKSYIYLEVGKEGFKYDKTNRIDALNYTITLAKRIGDIEKELVGKRVIKKTASEEIDDNEEIPETQPEDYQIITGLTKEVEGDIELGEDMHASTDIGKRRKNQEDAILLVRDKKIPGFKMAVVADGMGGWQKGEIASDFIVNELKDWFLNLSDEERKAYYNGVEDLIRSLYEKIEIDIQLGVEDKTWGLGGSTLVCAIVGEHDTLIANIGDSRAYIVKGSDIKQVSREDTAAQRNLEKGKTKSKEESRFDSQSNELLQCIGMDRRDLKHPHIAVIDNEDYDMLLLFSDGVTDCLSDEDIAFFCKNTDRKKLAKLIVEKAIRHDSVIAEENIENPQLQIYIPGGKDNASTVVIENEEHDR